MKGDDVALIKLGTGWYHCGMQITCISSVGSQWGQNRILAASPLRCVAWLTHFIFWSLSFSFCKTGKAFFWCLPE
jgi:hypothetical protein